MRGGGVTYELETSSFLSESVNFLSHITRPGELEIAVSITDDIKQRQDFKLSPKYDRHLDLVTFSEDLSPISCVWPLRSRIKCATTNQSRFRC